MSGGDATRHPEFAIARWAAEHMDAADRRQATVYTSGEHCPMCAAAHGWVGLGRIVYAASTVQLTGWLAEAGESSSPVKALPIAAVIEKAVVDGPALELAAELQSLHRRHAARRRRS